MNLARLRMVISLLIFTLFLFLFCGPEKISAFLSSTLLPFQVVPALIGILTHPKILFVAGFVFVMTVTLIFGRVYCSFLCPLGTLQDIFIAMSWKIGWRRKHAFQKSYHLLRNVLLGAVTVSALLGSMSLLNLLDPYSIAGRMVTQFVLPFFSGIYNGTVSVMNYFHVYLFSNDTAPLIFTVLLVNIAFFILILILSFRYGRLYCNTLCPVGTLLGWISRVSLFTFAIEQTGCNACLKCAGVCKAGCIDAEKAVIDQSRCVGCFNCVSSCPQSVIRYRPFVRKKEGEPWSPARRGVMIGSLAVAGYALSLYHSGIRNLLRTAHASAAPPVTPPGSVSLEHFTQSCSACHLCVSACPTKVLVPSLLEYGIGGLLQPKMNYPDSFCEYECNVCGRVCPTGAILPLSVEDKKMTQIGKVDLLKDKCVVYINHQNCGACVEVCPTKTITFINKQNVLYPVVDNRFCVGCGACSKACPTDPKSIVVHPHPVHGKAVKSLADGIPVRQKKAVPEEFPF